MNDKAWVVFRQGGSRGEFTFTVLRSVAREMNWGKRPGRQVLSLHTKRSLVCSVISPRKGPCPRQEVPTGTECVVLGWRTSAGLTVPMNVRTPAHLASTRFL